MESQPTQATPSLVNAHNLTPAPSTARRESYHTRSVHRRAFGRNNYAAISRKDLMVDGRVVGSFIVIERGWTTRDGVDKCTRFVTLPDSPNELNFVAETISALMLAHELADGADATAGA